MRVPQVNERVKGAPVQVVRAMFAGLGSLLAVNDKRRNKTATAPAPEAAATQATPAATEATVATETVVAETVVAETVVAETVVAEAVAPEATAAAETAVATEAPAAPEAPAATEETVVAETIAEPETVAAPVTDVALPLANYDDSSVASLRARLRNLSADQLTTLIEYEKSHAGREDVVAMFERRIAKLAEG